MSRLEAAEQVAGGIVASKEAFEKQVDALLREVELVAAIGEVIQQKAFEYHDDDTYRGYAAAMRDAAVRARDAARKRRADVAALEPQQRAVRHAAIEADYTALRAASRTALQDFRARSDRRRQEALDTAARARASARAYRAAVIAARAQGEPRAVHVRRVILLLIGETTPRRARVRAAAAAAAANSGPIGTTGLL